MTPKHTVPKLLCLAVSVLISIIIFIVALPKKPPLMPVLGNSTVSTAAAIKISLSSNIATKLKQFKESTPTQQAKTKPTSTTSAEQVERLLPKSTLQKKQAFTAPEDKPLNDKISDKKASNKRLSDEQQTDEITSNQQQNHAGKNHANQNPILLKNAGNASDIDSYLNQLSRHLARHYKYPSQARQLKQEGTAVIIFVFQRDGSLISHSIQGSSGYKLLDQAALDMLAQATPLPKVPATMQGEVFTYALPVRFRIR